MKHYVRGVIAVIIAALLRSLDGIVLRPQLWTLDPTIVVLVEHVLGTIVFLPFLMMGRKQVQRLDYQGWGALVWVSVFGGIVGTLFITKAFFMAFDGTVSFATVIILQKLQPLFALVMAAILLGERLSRSFYLWALVAIGATYVLAFAPDRDMSSIVWGSHAAIFALIAAFAFGSSTVFGKYALRALDYKRLAGMRFLLTASMMLVYIVLFGDISMLGDISQGQWGYFLTIVVSSGAVALFLYYYGLSRIKASHATILELARPVSAVLLDWLIHGTLLSLMQLFAAMVIIVAMIMISRMRVYV